MADTTTGTETTEVGAGEGAGKTAEAGAEGTKTTVLNGEGDAGKTAEGAEAGAKGAETELTDEEKAAAEKAAADAEKPEGPPEKYEFVMPEGMELDAALAEKVDPVLRDLKLSNEQANKLSSVFAEHVASEAQRQQDAYAQQVENWGKDAREDKEFGGAKFDESVPLAQKAIGQFGTPELKALLADGLGNHPELIRFCVRVGKAMGEDSGVDASNKTPVEKSAAATLYDHPTSQPKR